MLAVLITIIVIITMKKVKIPTGRSGFSPFGLTALRQARPEGHECSPLLLATANTCLFSNCLARLRTFLPLQASSSGYCSTRSSSTRSHSPRLFQKNLSVPTPEFRACFQAHHARTRSGFGRLRAWLRASAGRPIPAQAFESCKAIVRIP